MKHLGAEQVEALRKQALQQAEANYLQARLNCLQAEAALRAIEADFAPGLPAPVAERISDGQPSEAP